MDLLFGDSSASVEAEKEKTGGTMTSTDRDLDLEPWGDQDIDMTVLDMDSATRAALQGAVKAVQGSQVKKTRVVPVLRCLAVVTEVSQYFILQQRAS